jgi:hypothetical protein
MSMGTLLSMKPDYLRTRLFQLQADPRIWHPKLSPKADLANTETILPANTQTSVDIDPGHDTYISLTPSGQKAFSFLPFRNGRTTYMEIPDWCQLVLTGPLTGCNVWAFESHGKTVLVHANVSSGDPGIDWSGASGLGNMAAKQNAITAIKNQYPDAVDVARLTYVYTPLALGAMTYYGHLGFVLGCRARSGFSFNKHQWTKSSGSNTWTFWFYGYRDVAYKPVLLPM